MPISTQRYSRRRVLSVASASVLGSFLTACGGGSDSGTTSTATVSQADIDKAMQTPTTLTFWTWVPDISKEIAVFEKKYPAIKINVVNAGQGGSGATAEYTKLRTALKAGSGAPDLVQMEYQYIPNFSLTKSLVDLRPYGAAAVRSKFVDWTWSQVSGANGEVWAYPQDTGPMGMLYRADLFDKYGLGVPKTWDEFAADAQKLHDADPSISFTNLAANEPGVWQGLQWQAGAKPYTVDGTTVGLNVNDAASQKLASYWENLNKQGLISTDADFTDNWYQNLNKGKYATWLTAAWGPVFLSGSAPDTAGKWRAAPLPQWSAGDSASGNWGGSTTAVVKGTRNPVAAAKFAEFLNTDPTTTKMFNTEQSFFPATKALLADPSFTSQQASFYGNQDVNKVFADISGTVNTSFQWPPFLDQSVTDWTDTVGKALADKSDLSAAADQWQSRLVTYAKDQGFQVQGP